MTMSDDLNWKEWFKKHEGSGIALYYGEEPWITPDIEDFYQAFKARMIAELAAQAPDLQAPGLLKRVVSDGS